MTGFVGYSKTWFSLSWFNLQCEWGIRTRRSMESQSQGHGLKLGTRARGEICAYMGHVMKLCTGTWGHGSMR